ncbi:MULTISPECIES: hypothetical protein [Paenibacillus]|uniref:DUF3828 domain-containing protein n=1 Tax=Paenibacillus vandeheii TaxID=3035917 RepID=A0ABT8JGS1_9BACL|nr:MULTISPECIES: hypothetical protein [Paenibacillus]KGP77359.1 hypothetical protein P363_0133545 [Paenibacillus sp. MAEPY1]KGP78416.1 hypothetical protein P364_0128660 [Paenibacillus sp. MAEPY2]MDN4604033.1 hypothetical protein [Paenibacillus vandeheii]
MLKSIALTALLTSFILLTACGDTNSPTEEPTNTTNTSQNSASDTSKNPDSETESSTKFNSGNDIDFKEAESSLTEDQSPILDVLKLNLEGLVEHDHDQYRSGFVTEKLADAMEGYYSDDFQYHFSTIESIQKSESIKNQVHVTVLGERLDSKSDSIENVKMMYAIRMNNEGEWSIYTID